MTCKKIQELILTDYLDGELDQQGKTQVEEHLHQCPECRAYYELAGRIAVEPFLKAEEQKPSPAVWQGIEQAIRARQNQPPVLESFWEQLKAWLPSPRPALAFATAMVFVVVVGALTRYTVHPKINVSEQAAYLTQLADPNGDEASAEEGFGTNVEEYFL